jgi:methylenetetrahydrofolate dehydrogenase (NADP+) / methenyltetrahydrofolate cyclohydrolase
MPGQLIDGKAIAADVHVEVARRVAELTGEEVRPGLATILIGDDPASAVYVAAKQRACAETGIAAFDHRLPAETTREEVLGLIDRLNSDERVSGILCQLPTPAHLDDLEITNRIDPMKDVDGLTVTNSGLLGLGLPGLRPCTPAGVMHLLDRTGTRLRGAAATVLGRSNLFGKPMSQMLLAADATVTICHSRTEDLAAVTRQADILIAAVGRPHLVGCDWIKPGATVIDVGINRSDSGLVGDVDFGRAVEVAGAITPVPGGVGPMTIAMLLRNTVDAAVMQAGP